VHHGGRIMSWDLLKSTLQGLKAAGLAGFEGMLPRCFPELTESHSFVARTGDQHGIDARNHSGISSRR